NDIPIWDQCVFRSPSLYPGVSHETGRALCPAQTQSSKVSDQQRGGAHETQCRPTVNSFTWNNEQLSPVTAYGNIHASSWNVTIRFGIGAHDMFHMKQKIGTLQRRPRRERTVCRSTRSDGTSRSVVLCKFRMMM